MGARKFEEEKLMELIKQKKFGECGVACLAMVTGKDYDLVKEELIKFNIDFDLGLSGDNLVDYLHKQPGFVMAREVLRLPEHTPIEPATSSVPPAILTVPSLNHLGCLHLIVWDGAQYLDPSGPKIWPNDAPVIKGRRMVFWASAIVWSEP